LPPPVRDSPPTGDLNIKTKQSLTKPRQRYAFCMMLCIDMTDLGQRIRKTTDEVRKVFEALMQSIKVLER